MAVVVGAVVVADVGQKNADSCAGLQLQGITGTNLTINNNGVPTTVDCTSPTGN